MIIIYEGRRGEETNKRLGERGKGATIGSLVARDALEPRAATGNVHFRFSTVVQKRRLLKLSNVCRGYTREKNVKV